MSILEKEASICINSKNFKHYEELGYEIPKDKDNKPVVKIGTKIIVKVNDLFERSTVRLTKICDKCNKEIPNQPYLNIITSRNSNGWGKDVCKSCKNSLYWESKKENVIYENSLEYYAKNNNKEYLLDEYSPKNAKAPNEILFATGDICLWNCPKCKSEYDMKVKSRSSGGSKCPFCAGQRVNHTNCLWVTHPHVAELLVHKERGYKITYGQDRKEEVTCMSCGNTSFKKIHHIVAYGFGCTECSDGVSYSEKFVVDVLNQLKVQFEKEKVFKWSRKENKFKKYDFYIPELNCIIETHGLQHYINTGFGKMGSRTLEKEQINDNFKEKLAKDNGIKSYIIIECKISEYEYIKNSIINSELSNLLNLDSVDWIKCHEFACNSYIKAASDLWSSGIKSTSKIGEILSLHQATIIRYLKQGKTLGLCDYEKVIAKEVVQLSLEYEFIKEWESAYKVGRILNISKSGIVGVCKGTRRTAGGHKWMYKEDYEKYIEEQNTYSDELILS